MRKNVSLDNSIRPIILAGGIGSRLRPQTNYLPKPLLPINGRPILWYVLDSLTGQSLLPPIIGLDYKGDLIRTYFESNNAEFWSLPKRTMAETVLEIAEKDYANAFLGMSSDVLVHKSAVTEILKDYYKNGKLDTVLFTRLQNIGHKKWEFVVKDNYLQEIRKKDTQTNFERILLILSKQSLLKIRDILPRPVVESDLPDNVKKFQTGWTLILKTMIATGIRVYSRIVDLPVCNINVHSDFNYAEEFVKCHIG